MGVKFGVTLWGRAWLRTVETVTAGARNASLPQARTLAGNGSVVLAEIAAGRIRGTVTVKGTVFPVAITVPMWTAAQSRAVLGLLARAGARDRRIGAGEIPDEVVAQLLADGIAVASGLDECVAECDCAGRKRPCVHHLAAVYALALRIDEEPALAVRLRAVAAGAASGKKAVVEPLAASDWVALAQLDAATFYGS